MSTQPELVASLDAPSAGTFILSGLTLTEYRKVTLEVVGVTVTTDGTDVRLTFYTSGAEVTSGYDCYMHGRSSGGTSNADSVSGGASMLLVSNDANWDVGNAAAKSLGATIIIDGPGGTSLRKMMRHHTHCIGPTGNMISYHGGGVSNITGALDGFKVGGTSSLTGGRVRLWGQT